MPKFWLFQYVDGLWDIEKYCNAISPLPIRDESIQSVEAENRASALAIVVPEEEVIRRAFADVQKHGNEYAYKKWFSEEEFNEDGGMNKEAKSLLAEYSKRL